MTLETAVLLLRIGTVLTGASFTGLLVRWAWEDWWSFTRAEKATFWTLATYGTNVTTVTSLILSNPVRPNVGSSIHIGFILSFILGHRMVFLQKRA